MSCKAQRLLHLLLGYHRQWNAVVQNPGNDEPANAGLSNKADYKGGQKKQFGNYRWIACHDPSLLDMERCEFIFIGATEDLQGAVCKHQHLPYCSVGFSG